MLQVFLLCREVIMPAPGPLLTMQCRGRPEGREHSHKYTSKVFIKDRSLEEILEVRRHLGTALKLTEVDGKKGCI